MRLQKTNVVLLLALALTAFIQAAGQASAIPATALMNSEDVLKVIQSGKEKPLMIQVGSHVLYAQAHIPGSEYVGPASTDAGLQQLRQRVNSLPRAKMVVLYCGCCPWGHCPNVKPAYDALNAMGFKNLKVIYIPNNFGADWVDKGYPTARGE
jgi:thiosulfate/3-mercaptopyruvate sulfurtransferase